MSFGKPPRERAGSQGVCYWEGTVSLTSAFRARSPALGIPTDAAGQSSLWPLQWVCTGLQVCLVSFHWEQLLFYNIDFYYF